MLRLLFVPVAMSFLLLPPAPAAAQFRELMELFQPKQTPKPRRAVARPIAEPVPLPPPRPTRGANEPARPETAREETAAIPARVPLPPVPSAEPERQTAKAPSGGVEEVIEEHWSEDEVIAALRACVERLGGIVVKVEAVEPIKAGRCGTSAPVRVLRLGSGPGVEISPPATLNCEMVLALHSWIEKTVQPAARELLGSPVVRLRNATSYSCRNRNNRAEGKLSEHAFANALDVSDFFTADGRRVNPRQFWGPTERAIAAARRAAEVAQEASAGNGKPEEETPPQTGDDTGNDTVELPRPEMIPLPPLRQEAKAVLPVRNDAMPPPRPTPKLQPEKTFLHRVHDEACGTFATVLGPEANSAHEDHFHLDLAARRHGAFCE